jgi:hypothetical protein
VLVIAAFLFAAVAPDDAWTASVLAVVQSATLVCALWTSGVAEANSRPSLTLAALAVAAAISNLAAGGRVTTVAVALFTAVLTMATIGVIGLGVLDQGEVNRQSIRGAVAIYILLGLMFAFFYGGLAAGDATPFFAQGTDGTRALRVYFSYVTLATLGYGDYTAASTLGHTLAICEALLGQIYLVTVVALLVARLRVRRGALPEAADESHLIPPG